MYLLFVWASPLTGRGSWRDAGTGTRKGNFETLSDSQIRKNTAFAKAFWTDPCPPLRVVRVVQVETVGNRSWTGSRDLEPRRARRETAREELQRGRRTPKAVSSESHQGEL